MELTEPEFSRKITKSSLIVRPVAIEIHTAVLTSLKHLTTASGDKYKQNIAHMGGAYQGLGG